MLTADDEALITRAVMAALTKWSWVCALTGFLVWLVLYIIGLGGSE